MIAPAVVFAAALVAGLRWGRPALRALVVLCVVLAPLRGGLLASADDIGLANSSLAVNALVPSLVVALLIGVIVRVRPALEDLPKPLLAGWGLIGAVALINLVVQTVGLKLYGVGVAQYLVYPTLVIASWPLLEAGDERKLSRLVILMALVVALTVLVQATGVESFIQSASAEIDGFAANRYAGITGSYLHTSAFLGVAAVLVLGELLLLQKRRNMVLGAGLLTLILCGEILTFSRSGVVIFGIGTIALLVFAARGRRALFIVMIVPAVAAALVVGSIGGVSPGAASARVSSGFNPSGDQGNELRTKAFGDGLSRFSDANFSHKLLGEGLAATGNARKLVSGQVVTVESYYLKLLVETGVVGLLLIGGFLLWAIYLFARTLWIQHAPWQASVAAAGLGLSLYNAIYPALETQILALTWWLLLALCLRQSVQPRGVTEPKKASLAVTTSPPEQASALAR